MKPGIDYVGVGIGVMIVQNGKVLMQRREGSHGAGTWALPGGHLELNETFENCAKREASEEIGVKICPKEIISVSNNIAHERHYVTIGVLADIAEGEPKIMEPDKCVELKWFALDNLPENLFHASARVIAHYKGEPLG